MTKMVVFGNFWLFLMVVVVIVYNPKMAAVIFVAKHQLSLFSQYWLFESYWPPKRELKKTCLRQKMGCSTRICYFVLHFLFWGPILVCRSKKMADYNLRWCWVFWIFWSRTCWWWPKWCFFGYFLITSSVSNSTWTLSSLLKIVARDDSIKVHKTCWEG